MIRNGLKWKEIGNFQRLFCKSAEGQLLINWHKLVSET
jgi:hypothetical protein